MIAASPALLISVTDLDRFFTDIGTMLPSRAPRTANIEMHELEDFFADAAGVIDDAERWQRELDRTEATRFNVFDLIGPDENGYSDILADLLDPRGRHGQGSIFLSLLLQQLGIGANVSLQPPVTIRREAPTHGIEKFRRRIDILIESDVLVAIENKIDSPEQWEQVKDYLEYLQVHSRGWSTPAALVYVTPNGRVPSSVAVGVRSVHRADGRLHCWSYGKQLRGWLTMCHASCEADKMRYFLADFIRHIDTTLKRRAIDPEREEQR